MNEATERQVAREPNDLMRLLVERAAANDVDGMVACYETDALLATGKGRLASGAEVLRTFYGKLLAKGVPFSLGEQRPALIQGDLALTSTKLPNGSVTAEVARRQADGTWRWVIDQPAIAS